jgi:phenylalanyl-tRNA synthetase alpha chain
MLDELNQLRAKALAELAQAGGAEALERLRVAFLGRKGQLNAFIERLPGLSASERPAVGRLLNEIKRELSEALSAAQERLTRRPATVLTTDVTEPGRRPRLGRPHLITQTIDRIVDVFGRLGFSVAYGPEVELVRTNFDALNTPPDHPARDPIDNFYITRDTLLRTQTSTVQIRVMESTQPPVRVVAPGRCYRPDAVDATHSWMFHQVEGLAVDEGITFADLKSVLTEAARALFGEDVKTRFRPHFFPFTEPSAEMDLSCHGCGGAGCPMCRGEGWIELLGCGMVDPNVFETVGYDPERFTGFAFGIGVERTAMRLHGITDMRLFFENDVRFLAQF